jgi:hypothetical protein
MPEGEEPFEATIKTRWYPSAGGLHRGVVVEVLYDPNDHDKIVIDYEAALRDAEARIDQQRSGWSARGLVETPTGLESASGEPLSTPDLGASVARLNEATELLRAKLAPRGVTPGAPPSQDPVDRLVKLADLRNRGVLTDAEFEAEKKKILES